MIPVILRTVDPIPDHPKGQKLVITLSRPLEWHSKHTRCKLYIIDQLRLIKLFMHISDLVLHYPQNFATQTFIWKSAIFQIFANITSQWLFGFQNLLLNQLCWLHTPQRDPWEGSCFTEKRVWPCSQHTLVCGPRGNSFWLAVLSKLWITIGIVPIRKSICFDCVYCVTLQVQCYPCRNCEPEELKECVTYNENHTMFHCQDVQKGRVKVKKVSNTKWISPE